MSYWGIIVGITFLTVIPIFGNIVSEWIYCSSFIIINRIFVFHFMLSLTIGAMAIFHLAILHSSASSNPYINSRSSWLIPFTFILNKDIFSFNYFVLAISFMFFIEPDILGNKLNFSKCINYSIKHYTWMIFLFILFHY